MGNTFSLSVLRDWIFIFLNVKTSYGGTFLQFWLYLEVQVVEEYPNWRTLAIGTLEESLKLREQLPKKLKPLSFFQLKMSKFSRP